MVYSFLILIYFYHRVRRTVAKVRDTADIDILYHFISFHLAFFRTS